MTNTLQPEFEQGIPSRLRPYFKEYNPDRLDLERDAILIIQRTVRIGDWDEVHRLFRRYRRPIIGALSVIVITIMLSACQISQGVSLPIFSLEDAVIRDVMTQERQGWHIEANTIHIFAAEEVGDWVLVGVRLNAQIQNNLGGPIERVGCVFVVKTEQKSIGWEASSAGGLCTVLDVLGREPLTISSGWARSNNFRQEPAYNVVYGFLEPEISRDFVVTWQDGESTRLTSDKNTFMVVHPGLGEADYSQVEFFNENGEVITVYQPLR
jgi:hypothetical protein